MFDAIIISDLHLGSSVCRPKKLLRFLNQINTEEVSTKKFILAGDVFDNFHFERMDSLHWQVLSEIRRISQDVEVIWISGNHDGPSEIISHLVGSSVVNKYFFETSGKKVIILHGDKFDEFSVKNKLLTEIAGWIYFLIQKIDKDFYLSSLLKKNNKSFIRCTEIVRKKAIKYAVKKGYNVICCGHTHHAEVFKSDNIEYFNCGSWTERENHYITVENGEILLKQFF